MAFSRLEDADEALLLFHDPHVDGGISRSHFTYIDMLTIVLRATVTILI